MARVYDTAFKVGFAVVVAAFLVGNFISYVLAWIEHRNKIEQFKGNMFLHGSPPFPNWGFPFPIYGYDSFMFQDGFVGLVLNISTAFVAAFVLGFVFRFVCRASRFSVQRDI